MAVLTPRAPTSRYFGNAAQRNTSHVISCEDFLVAMEIHGDVRKSSYVYANVSNFLKTPSVRCRRKYYSGRSENSFGKARVEIMA